MLGGDTFSFVWPVVTCVVATATPRMPLTPPPRFRLHESDETVQELSNPVSAGDLLPDLLRLAQRTPSIDAVALTGGEPLIQADFLAELLSDERLPHPRLLETNGTLPDRLSTLLPVVDIVSMDIKLPSNTGERESWDAHAHSLRIATGKSYIKVLVDSRTDPAEVGFAAELVAANDPTAPFFLQPVTGTDGRVAVPSPMLDLFFDVVRRCLKDVRILPQIHPILGAGIR